MNSVRFIQCFYLIKKAHVYPSHQKNTNARIRRSEHLCVLYICLKLKSYNESLH